MREHAEPQRRRDLAEWREHEEGEEDQTATTRRQGWKKGRPPPLSAEHAPEASDGVEGDDATTTKP